MAKLPTRDNLSGAVSMRSGRQIATYDTTAIGRGIAEAGAALSGLGVQIREKNNTVDVALAEAAKTEGLLGVQNEFDVDPDYSTFKQRAPVKTGEVIKNAANLIRDPVMRQKWLLGAQIDAARYNDSIFDRGVTLGRQAEVVALDDALEINRRLYVDPDTPEEVKAKARADIEGTLATAEATGLLTPDMGNARRKVFLEDADVSRGELLANSRPDEIPRPLPRNVAGRAEAAMAFYMGRGYTKEQAAGIVGNLIAESNLTPSGAVGDNGTAFGIAQWRGERLTRLKRFAAANGKDWQTFETQLAFVDMELQNHETAAYRALKNAKTVDEATAAFIGYERPRGWTANNPRGGHNYGGRLKFAAQAAGQEVSPDWYQRLSPERQADLQSRAIAQQQSNDASNAAKLKAEQAAAKDNYSLRIATMDPSLTERAILSDPVLDNGDKAALINTFNTKMEESGNIAAALQQFAVGQLMVDPFDEKARKTVDKMYDRALTAVPPEQVQPLTEEVVRQTGVVPKAAMNAIRAGVQSTDIGSVTAALQAAQRLSAVNPAALGRRDGGGEVQGLADDFAHYVRDLNLSPEDAARRIMDARDPAKKMARKAMEPAAKEFVKSMEKANIADAFDTWLGAEPDVGFTPGQALGIQAEFLALAEDAFYASNGDPELAKNRAMEEMKRLYGVTGITGRKVVMKHPPERYWPQFSVMDSAQSLSYRAQLENDLKAIDPGVDMSKVQLVTTPETDAMIKRGEMPGYAVLYQDANGVYQSIPGKLWLPDLTRVQEMQGNIDAAERAAREDAARARQAVERQRALDTMEGRDRERSLDNFLDGPVFPRETPAPELPPVVNPPATVDDVEIPPQNLVP